MTQHPEQETGRKLQSSQQITKKRQSSEGTLETQFQLPANKAGGAQQPAKVRKTHVLPKFQSVFRKQAPSPSNQQPADTTVKPISRAFSPNAPPMQQRLSANSTNTPAAAEGIRHELGTGWSANDICRTISNRLATAPPSENGGARHVRSLHPANSPKCAAIAAQIVEQGTIGVLAATDQPPWSTVPPTQTESLPLRTCEITSTAIAANITPPRGASEPSSNPAPPQLGANLSCSNYTRRGSATAAAGTPPREAIGTAIAMPQQRSSAAAVSPPEASELTALHLRPFHRLPSTGNESAQAGSCCTMPVLRRATPAVAPGRSSGRQAGPATACTPAPVPPVRLPAVLTSSLPTLEAMCAENGSVVIDVVFPPSTGAPFGKQAAKCPPCNATLGWSVAERGGLGSCTTVL